MLESKIEKYLVDKVKEMGGLCYKFTSPGQIGVPDRLIVFEGSTYFVELKRKGQVPIPIQTYQMDRLIYQGMNVVVIDSREGIDAFILRIKAGDFN